MKLDEWQERILKTSGNIVLRAPRQSGKSTVVSIKAAMYAVDNPQKSVLVISHVERQAEWIFEKILNYIYTHHRKMIRGGKHKPTRHRLELNNGSMINCLPTGVQGLSIRGFTVDLLIADEAAYIDDMVWRAVTPMLATRYAHGARIILLSTPRGKEGYFYNAFEDPSFEKFHIKLEECPRLSKEFLEQEKKRMSRLEFAQEYLAEFVDELIQFFPTELIRKCMIRKRESFMSGEHYLGIDVAARGKDETTFQIVKREGEHLIHIENKIWKGLSIPNIAREVIQLNRVYQFRRIYIDDGGVGIGVFDILMEDPATRRKTIAINNASRPLDRDERRKKKILKEDLYTNLLRLMEAGSIEILDDDEIFQSFLSVQYEYTESNVMRIFGKYTHIVEGLIRACWCVKEKNLNIWIQSS